MHVRTRILKYMSRVTSLFRAATSTSVVVCPTAQLPANVRLRSDGSIESCSRRPQLEGCSQTCSPQLQFSADNLNEFVMKYEGKHCVSCGAVLTRDDWYKSRLTIPMKHPTTLNTHPICSACSQARVVA